jgi:peroxiredoxin
MRQSIILLFVILIKFSGAFSQKGYTITGKVKGAEDSTIVYLENYALDDFPEDSAYIIKEKFQFKGSVPNPMEYILYLEDEDSDVLNFWLENSNIKLSATASQLNNATVRGSRSHIANASYVDEVKNIKERLKADYYSDTAEALTKQFIEKHPGSYKSAQELYLFREYLSADEEKKLFTALSEDIRQSRTGQLIATHIANRKDLKIGSEAPNFTLQTLDGKSVSLSSFRGKNVVLLFWASWCAPCRAANAEYNNLFDKYKSDDVVFLGVGLDKKEDMREAVKEDKIKWQNVITPWDSPIAYKYGVFSVPDNVVIDKEGKVVEMDLFPNNGKTDKDGKNHPSLDSLLKTLSDMERSIEKRPL